MHIEVTTPFGRRVVPLAMIKSQLVLSKARAGHTIDKWKIYRDVCAARSTLGLRDRALAVLRALLSFHPSSELAGGSNLIVFPSNEQLATRANGIAGTTLRENLAILVTKGLIHRKDSPNGKRYARRNHSGNIETAYGFDLSPLLVRAEEFALTAAEVAATAQRTKALKEGITLCRRDIRLLISTAIDEGVAGDWVAVQSRYNEIVSTISRAKTPALITIVLNNLEQLRTNVLNELKVQVIPEKTVTNASEIRHHIQNTKTESYIEFEVPLEKSEDYLTPNDVRPIKAYPLEMVLKACPNIVDYGPQGSITSWRDLTIAASTVVAILGITPSAYQTACAVMGIENVGAVVACILQKVETINCPGGYLRDLTTKAKRGKFSLGPMLMALLRANGSHYQKKMARPGEDFHHEGKVGSLGEGRVVRHTLDKLQKRT
ncbi:plasmid replication protein RepC [Agrobacterium tumefaciens]|uniref:Replication initiation protein RepC n=1 Tax=Agrobacterium tumefaciens TaxID=358 RepID=A0AAW8M244_AGRTU|nr:plasmid replication protein RepC [Agrobacterium tumefaciens]MBP2568731.1 replication initiation protein RepC [Agrobacterium tumefaciens]MDR6705286.1 replication initiation protein RepC [Agrobacterium tumefaciens]TCV46294.1 replication initiation protein RepC [Agrobacterium tumefaciens]